MSFCQKQCPSLLEGSMIREFSSKVPSCVSSPKPKGSPLRQNSQSTSLSPVPVVEGQGEARNIEAWRSQKPRGATEGAGLPNPARSPHKKVTSHQVRGGPSSARSPSQPAAGQLSRGAKAGGKKPGRAGSEVPVGRQHPETPSKGTGQKQPGRRKSGREGPPGADGRHRVGVRSRDADTTEVPVWQLGTEDRDTQGTAGHMTPRGGRRDTGLGVLEVWDRGRGALRH